MFVIPACIKRGSSKIKILPPVAEGFLSSIAQTQLSFSSNPAYSTKSQQPSAQENKGSWLWSGSEIPFIHIGYISGSGVEVVVMCLYPRSIASVSIISYFENNLNICVIREQCASG